MMTHQAMNVYMRDIRVVLNYEIIADGSKNETIVRDNYRLVVGQDTLEVYGDVRIIVSGHC